MVDGGRSAVRAPATTVGDAAELLDVHVHQLAGPGPLVAGRGLLRGPDDFPGHRVQYAQPGRSAADQNAGDRAGRHAQLGADPVRPPALTVAQLDDAVLDLGRGPGRAGVRAAGPILEAGVALGLPAGDPGPHALA